MTDHDDSEGIVAPRGPATIQDRIAAFQMLDGMPDATQAQKIVRLTLIGFNRNEVAAILQTSPQTVSQTLYSERKRTAKTPRAPRAKPAAAKTNE